MLRSIVILGVVSATTVAALDRDILRKLEENTVEADWKAGPTKFDTHSKDKLKKIMGLKHP
jgi:ABC-type phosphate transport system permease subunit